MGQTLAPETSWVADSSIVCTAAAGVGESLALNIQLGGDGGYNVSYPSSVSYDVAVVTALGTSALPGNHSRGDTGLSSSPLLLSA